MSLVKWQEDTSIENGKCEDDLSGMRCVGKDIARNDISQVGENCIRVLRATILIMDSVEIKIYFRYMVHRILENIRILDHERR